MVCNVWYAVYFLVWIIKDGFASPDLNKCKFLKEFKTDCFFFFNTKKTKISSAHGVMLNFEDSLVSTPSSGVKFKILN